MPKTNILLIEDDHDQILMMQALLSAEKYNVDVICDGTEAMEYLLNKNNHPDLVLLDYHLPQTDGITIMQQLKEKGIKHNIVFLTADYSIENAIRSINSGAIDFIPKDGRYISKMASTIDKLCENIENKKVKDSIEKALKESENRLRVILEATNDTIFEIDFNKNIFKSFIESSKHTKQEQIKDLQEYTKSIHPDDLSLYQKSIQEHIIFHTSIYEVELRKQSNSNEYRWILEKGVVIEKNENSDAIKIIGTQSDITDRKDHEQKILRAIIETEERERKRFSEDLHDEMGALLSTIKMYVNTAFDYSQSEESRKQLITRTNELVDCAITTSKEIANNLSPNIIKNFGLISSLQSFCNKIEFSSGVKIELNTKTLTNRLHEELEIALYRIFTELINNSIKHSESNNISLHIFEEEENLEIQYSDAGKGFDFEKMLKARHYGMGLQNIVSRIKLFNGSYELLKQKPGFGIKIIFPIKTMN
jgi:signal transduction histidine kinase/CheY-like chemotaxis protein